MHFFKQKKSSRTKLYFRQNLKVCFLHICSNIDEVANNYITITLKEKEKLEEKKVKNKNRENLRTYSTKKGNSKKFYPLMF